jgi:hypothetical protein
LAVGLPPEAVEPLEDGSLDALFAWECVSHVGVRPPPVRCLCRGCGLRQREDLA